MSGGDAAKTGGGQGDKSVQVQVSTARLAVAREGSAATGWALWRHLQQRRVSTPGQTGEKPAELLLLQSHIAAVTPTAAQSHSFNTRQRTKA